MGIIARNRLRALKYLLKSEKHEKTIASGRDDYDSYWIYLERNERRAFVNEDDPLDPPTELVKMIIHPSEDGRILASRMKTSRDDVPPTRTITEMIASEATFEVIHYFKDVNFTYSSPITAALFRRLGLSYLQFWLLRLNNEILGRRIKSLKSRLEVLQVVIDLHEQRYGDIKFYVVSHRILGPKLSNIRHQKKLEHWRQVRNIIESLIYTEELKHKGHQGAVEPTGKAYASLMDWQREVEEKNSQVRREIFVIILTSLIAFGTLMQACSIN